MPRNAVPQVGATWPQIGVGVGVDVGVGEQHRQRRRWQRRQLRRRRRRCRRCCRFRCPSSTITVGKQFPDLPHHQRECAAFKRETSASCVSFPARSYGKRNWLNCRNGKPEMCDIGRQLHTLFLPLSLPSLSLAATLFVWHVQCRQRQLRFVWPIKCHICHELHGANPPPFSPCSTSSHYSICSSMFSPTSLPRRVCSFLINH